jgi:hypothetical protein
LNTSRKARVALAVVIGTFVSSGVAAQGAPQPVSWSISLPSGVAAKPGDRLVIDVTAHIIDGWHVYGVNQAEGGPTPLRISAESNGIVRLAGTPTGTSPIKRHDTSFDLDTEIFDHQFTLHVPVLVSHSATEANEQIGLNVRFQACNDHICLPPKTVHLTASFKTPANAQ